MSARILVVDDDAAVLSGLRRALSLAGYEVFLAHDGYAALATVRSANPDLVVLDLILPGCDGLEVCRELRGSSSVPILILTAKDTVPDRVAGLDEGADDYLVKPFSIDELLARVRALLRRARPAGHAVRQYADVELDDDAHQARRAGHPLHLTPHEYALLDVFLRHAGRALSRDQLCAHVWGYAFDGASNFVDVAVKDLRKKLEAQGHPRVIQTVRGYGYVLREA